MNLRRWIGWFVVAIGASATPLAAQDGEPDRIVRETSAESVTLTVELDKQRLTIADQLQVKVMVTAPPEALINVPRISRQFGQFAELSQYEAGPIIRDDGLQYWERRYMLTPEYVGELMISPQTIYYSHDDLTQKTTECMLLRQCPGGEWSAKRASPKQMDSDPIMVTVDAIVPEDASVLEPQDIAAPVPLARPSDWMWWVLALGVLLLILVPTGAIWLRKRWQAASDAAAEPPGTPAHELALAALAELSRANLIDQHRVEEFCVRLSDILRGYVVWRFNVRAPHQTTEEFLLAAQRADGLNGDMRGRAGEVLARCDQVKFGRAQPTSADMTSLFGQVRGFIDQTADASVTVRLASLRSGS